MKIWAHCITYNEENFVWFALMSVVDFVDKILVWDTGSTDQTVKIIQEAQKLKPEKIEFHQYGKVDNTRFTVARQEMLEKTNADFILILDGDEIWWRNSIHTLVGLLKAKGKDVDAVAVPFVNTVGDIYHYQVDSEGHYQIKGRRGHLTIRAINTNIPGLHVDKPYGAEGYYDKEDCPIQSRENIIYLDTPFLHLSHLSRSSHPQKISKIKYQLGENIIRPLPEVLYQPYPGIIKNPLRRRSKTYIMRSALLYPAQIIKRKLRDVR